MSEDFYPFVDSGDPAPDNTHLAGDARPAMGGEAVENTSDQGSYTIRISVYDDMLSTPRVIVVEQSDVRTYLEDVTNTVYRTMKEQGGKLSLMIIRELVENFIHAQFSEPVISILDNGNTIRFADQGPGIGDKERAFEFGVTSADREKKRYIRGTGAGLPMVQQYVENAGGAIAVEDNLGSGTVVTVSVDPKRSAELEHAVSRGAAVRSGCAHEPRTDGAPPFGQQDPWSAGAMCSSACQGRYQQPAPQQAPDAQAQPPQQYAGFGGYPPAPIPQMGMATQGAPVPQPFGMQGFPAQAPYGPRGAYPQPQPYYPGYQQGFPMQGFQQQPQYPQAGISAQGYPQQMPAQPQPGPYVSERGAAALIFIYQNGKGGPTDLTRALGKSDATWSRELDALASTGLVHKPRQKYVLTDMGKAWVEQGMGTQ